MNVFYLLIGRLLESVTTTGELLTATAASVDTTADATASTAADSALSTASEASSTGIFGNGMLGTILLFAVLILAMYFLMIRPQKKRDKEQKMMRDALAVGDEIVTIGGIAGTVVSVREDSIVIETGSDRDKMKIMKWAIQTITAMRKSEDAKE